MVSLLQRSFVFAEITVVVCISIKAAPVKKVSSIAWAASKLSMCAGVNKDNWEHFSNLRLFDILILVEKECIQVFVVTVDSVQCHGMKVVLYFCVYLEVFLVVGYDMTIDV